VVVVVVDLAAEVVLVVAEVSVVEAVVFSVDEPFD
jgi:hypothetical protein